LGILSLKARVFSMAIWNRARFGQSLALGRIAHFGIVEWSEDGRALSRGGVDP